ncbi:MAG: hypothetical protein QOD03_1081 [Verrucomicrobiota bacterium]
MARQDTKTLVILHVEDDENDAILLANACERARLPVVLHRVADAEEAREYLLGHGAYGDRFKNPAPHVLVLDLKMPRVDGFEFLKWLRSQEAFLKLPVLIFTASVSHEDKARALAEGATSYFIKPASFDALVQMVEMFKVPDSGQLN